MLKLLTYLKPYILILIVTIALLFVQAAANLALPDYMSGIINYGIQQGGIENAVPMVIKRVEFEKLLGFIPSAQRRLVTRHYLPFSAELIGSDLYENTVNNYPWLKNQDVYILNTDSKAVIKELNPVMALALVKAESASAELPAGVTSPDTLPESMITQVAVSLIRTQYEAFGINMLSLQMRYLFSTGLLMLLIALGGMAATILASFFAVRTATGMCRAMRLDVFSKIESFSSIEFDKFSPASLITRTTNDIQQIQMFLVMLLRNVLYAPILGIGGVIKVLQTNVSMAWITGVGIAGIIILVGVLFAVSVPKFLSIQKMVDKINLVMRENLSGMMVIRAFNTQKYEEERFDKANQDYTQTSRFVNRLMALLMPLMMFVMNGVTLLIVWIGSQQIDAGVMQVGNMMAFMQYALLIFISFFIISAVAIMFPRAAASARRITEVISTEVSIADPVQPVTVFDESKKGYVEFKDVCFKYPGAEDCVVHDITFTAKPGETTAFIGSTGSGKSTLVNLIPRFYDVTEGEVTVGGVNIRSIPIKDLRDKIGYVPQKAVLFSGTIETNLRYGNEYAAEDLLRKSAKTAQALDFIEQTSEQFNSPIAQGGSNVSGGQKQRLAIARALVKNAEIYIFDDSFSALDFKTDAALRKALAEDTSGSTILIVAQRISTIMKAQQIIVLDKGGIAGVGTHSGLMKTCAIYREIAESQLSEKELNA